MRKKAALGCALIHNPPVLFSSHVMELVEQVCDHVSIIDKGKIVVTGTIDEVRGGKTLQRAFIAIFTFLVLAGFRGKSTSVELTSVIFTVFAFGWLIAPILVFGLDSTLDPATLALYPLRIRGLAVGLLAASFTGFWPLANVIGLLGVTVGLASGAFGVIVAVVAVVLQVLFCIALSRFLATSLAGLLRSRRGRDLAAFMIIPLFALYEFFTQVVPKAVSEGKITAASFTGFDSWMRWLPPGLAAHAIQDASDGRPGMAFARLGLWPPSSSFSSGCGSARSGGLWLPSTRLLSRRGSAARGCRCPGWVCAARSPPGSGSIGAVSRCRSSTGRSPR
jgi:hypothetical protein